MPGFGLVDLSSDKHSVEKIKKMHEAGCPYLTPVLEKKNVEVPPEIELSSKDILEAVNNATNIHDAKYYASLRPDNKGIQKAYDKKLIEFNDNDLP